MLIPALIVASVVGLVLTALDADTDSVDISVTSNEALDALVPSRGAEILSQDVVGVDLAVGWDASLRVNGIVIPTNQLTHEPARNRVFFRPGEGQALVALAESTNCVEAIVWRITEGPERARDPIRWCFEVT